LLLLPLGSLLLPTVLEAEDAEEAVAVVACCAAAGTPAVEGMHLIIEFKLVSQV